MIDPSAVAKSSPPLWLSAAAIVVLALASSDLAAQTPVEITVEKVEIGYGGICKSGFWAPLRLSVRASSSVGGQLQVVAPDGDRIPVIFAAHAPDGAVELEAGKESTHSFFVKIGPEQSPLSARLVSPQSGSVLWESELSLDSRPLPASWEIAVSFGKSEAEAASLLRRPENQKIVSAAVTDPALVPDVWWGWEGVETIFLNPTGESAVRDLTEKQWEALHQWVTVGGGRLVISVSPETLASQPAISRFLPGTGAGAAPLRSVAELERLTGESFSLPDEAEQRPQVTQLNEIRGSVELFDRGIGQEVPLLVRSSLGFGEVVFVALDLEHPAIRQWSGRAAFLAAAIGGSRNGAAAPAPRRSTTRLGYDDLIGQLRLALDRYPNVLVVNFTTVFVLMVGYLILIGPVDYLVLQRTGLPRWVTWLTFPLLAVLFCIIGWYFGRAAHGRSVQVNQAEIIDVDYETQFVRGTAWFHIYSPSPGAHDLSLNLARSSLAMQSAPEGWLGWQGLPGDGLGGLASQQLAAVELPPYSMERPSPQPQLAQLPVQVAASKSLCARWWSTAKLGQSSSLSLNEFGLLDGEVANPLPIDLFGCLLIYGDRMYRLNDVGAGQRLRISLFDPLNLEARLQQRSVAGSKEVASPWERDSQDVPRILQMLMFHESARGTTYTSLSHRFQSYLDLTPRTRNGRAILVGRAAQPIATLTLDGQPLAQADSKERWVWVRVVLPVTASAAR